MSLLADILDLLRNLLEYFGVPADMLVPVWENQYCGQYRSIVRMIGSNLPLTPHARVHFQIPMQTFQRDDSVDIPFAGPAIPTLADVMWLAEDDGEAFAKFRNSARPLNGRPTVQTLTHPPARALVPTRPARGVVERNLPCRPPANTEALKKITALEDELLMLRAQIAMIVTMPSGPVPFQSTPGTPGMSPPTPVLASTPRCPPPPPPLPPHCSVTMETVAQGTIKQRRTASKPERSKDHKSGLASANVPSMLDVLKNLNQVKLRAVERSPGGTPVMKRSKRAVSLGDPAALIAEALKRKFAHRYKEDSLDKENRSFELSPFGSPETLSIPLNVRRLQL